MSPDFCLRGRFVMAGLLLVAAPAIPREPAPIPSVVEDAERRAAARTLFEEGLSHADAGRWADASDRFQRAHALRPSPEITYNLSTAFIRQGRLVGASELLRQAARDPSGSPAVRQAAATRLAQILPRLGYLTVRPSATPVAGTIFFDGQPLAPPLVGVALPVDPGMHVVELRRGKHVELSRTAAVAEGARQVITFDSHDDLLMSGAAAGEGHESRRTGPGARKVWLWVAAGALVAGAALAVGLSLAGSDLPRGNVDTWQVGGATR